METPPENATSPLRLRTTSSAVASSLFADSPTSAQPQMKSTLQRHDSVANFSYRVPSDDESSVDDRAEETCSLSEFAVLLNVAFWDENADGRITEREVRFNVGRLRSVGVDTMAIEALLDKARQENADVSVGTLSKVLHNAHANVAQAMTVFAHFDQHAVLHATHILDEMDTGYVTVDSVKTVMKRLGVKSSEADIVAMMAQADTSGNGQVKTKEFTRLLATELKVLREQQTKDMSTFELGSDGIVGEMDDFEDGSVHSNLSSSDTIELAEKVLLKSALKMQKDAQDKLMQRGKKGGGKNNKNNSEDSKDQQSAETGALAEETYELSIEEYKVERHGSVLAAKARDATSTILWRLEEFSKLSKGSGYFREERRSDDEEINNMERYGYFRNLLSIRQTDGRYDVCERGRRANVFTHARRLFHRSNAVHRRSESRSGR